MEEIKTDALISNVDIVTEFVNAALERFGFGGKDLTKVDIAVDELFSNIARYSYGEAGGQVVVQVDYDEAQKAAAITFIDEGRQYDPLKQPDPDLSLVEDDETIGGFGIFITKKMMDDVRYEYQDGKNILIIYKKTS